MSTASSGTQVRLTAPTHKPGFAHTAAGGGLTVAVAAADQTICIWQAGICGAQAVQDVCWLRDSQAACCTVCVHEKIEKAKAGGVEVQSHNAVTCEAR